MKKYFLLSIIIFSVSNCVKAQIIFQKIYATLGTQQGDLTSDGGYMILGQGPTTHPCLLKTDSSGAVSWVKGYDSSVAYDDFRSFQQTDDGGYIVIGSTDIDTTGFDIVMVLLKTDANGDTLWTKYYGNSGYNFSGYFVRQTADHGYIIIAGGETGTSSEAYLLRTDSAGNLLWNHSYGGSMRSAYQTPDGGFIVSNAEFNGIYHAASLMKTDSAGNITWSRLYSATSLSQKIWGYDVEQTQDGGFIIPAFYSNQTDESFYLIKTNSSGDTLWTKAYFTGHNYHITTTYEVHQTSDGGYIAGGNLYDSNYPLDMFALKTDSMGNVTWMRKYGGAGGERFTDIRQTPDGGYMLTGAAGVSAYLIKTDPNGVSGCNDSALYPTIFVPGMMLANSYYIDSDPIYTGSPLINVNSISVQDSILCSSFVNIEQPVTDEIKFFQNPFTTSTVIDLGNVNSKYDFALYNAFGKLIQSAQHISGRYELKRGSLPAGIYFYRFSSKDSFFSGKVIIQ